MGSFLSLYVTVLTVSFIAGCGWLIWWQRKRPADGATMGQTLGHSFDGIQEFNNPLPMWWLGIFVGTIVWSVYYLAAYPGLGDYKGFLGWSSHGQYDAEVQAAEDKYGPIFDKYAAMELPALLHEEQAQRMGARIFANNCATCHGSDARGSRGFPNLTDDDWKWGGEPAEILATITNGRNGIMPAFAPAIGDENIDSVIAYVLSLSGNTPAEATPAMLETGKAKYSMVCVACHGADGTGNKILGSPNLTDDIWLFGNTAEDIREGLYNGRQGMMPAHGRILGPRKTHVVAAYVYGLSRRGN